MSMTNILNERRIIAGSKTQESSQQKEIGRMLIEAGFRRAGSEYRNGTYTVSVDVHGAFTARKPKSLPLTGQGIHQLRANINKLASTVSSIQACYGEPGMMNAEAVKLDKSDKNHPSNSHSAGHEACMNCGMDYKHSQRVGDMMAHTYEHPVMQDHVEKVARR